MKKILLNYLQSEQKKGNRNLIKPLFTTDNDTGLSVYITLKNGTDNVHAKQVKEFAKSTKTKLKITPIGEEVNELQTFCFNVTEKKKTKK